MRLSSLSNPFQFIHYCFLPFELNGDRDFSRSNPLISGINFNYQQKSQSINKHLCALFYLFQNVLNNFLLKAFYISNFWILSLSPYYFYPQKENNRKCLQPYLLFLDEFLEKSLAVMQGSLFT